MRPDRMGKSKWVKLNPWYYTGKRQRSRHAVLREAVAAEAHHDCLVLTAHQELELFGDIVSTSVKDHVEEWLLAFDARTRTQYQPPQPRLPDPGQPELVGRTRRVNVTLPLDKPVV